MIEFFLSKAIKQGASDLHISCGMEPTLRLNGSLIGMNLPKVRNEDMTLILLDLLDDKMMKIYQENRQIDFASVFDSIRVRVHVYRQMDSDALAIRILSKAIPSLSDLNLPKSLEKLTEYRDGLVLITGPTGSGKSSTLAALVDIINTRDRKHIISLEDPIEYIYENKRSIIHQREVGRDVISFSDGVRSSMREDLDILVIGELRDLESIRNCMTMAETGHLVFATIHTKSVAETISRIVDVFPVGQGDQIRVQLSDNLRGIVCQELLVKDKVTRLVNCEIMFINNAIRNLIRERGNINSIVDQIFMNSKELGCQSRVQGLARLLEDEKLEIEEVYSVLNENEKKALNKILKIGE